MTATGTPALEIVLGGLSLADDHAGALVLVGKSTHEMHQKLEGDVGHKSTRVRAALSSAVVGTPLLDVAFSLDSVITAIGFVKRSAVMAAAVVVAVGIMVLRRGGQPVHRAPSDFQMAFSTFVEVLDPGLRRAAAQPVRFHEDHLARRGGPHRDRLVTGRPWEQAPCARIIGSFTTPRTTRAGSVAPSCSEDNPPPQATRAKCLGDVAIAEPEHLRRHLLTAVPNSRNVSCTRYAQPRSGQRPEGAWRGAEMAQSEPQGQAQEQGPGPSRGASRGTR